MSFGFSISDFFAVGQLAWQVYKSCKLTTFFTPTKLTMLPGKGAGRAFEEVSHEGKIVLAVTVPILKIELMRVDPVLSPCLAYSH